MPLVRGPACCPAACAPAGSYVAGAGARRLPTPHPYICFPPGSWSCSLAPSLHGVRPCARYSLARWRASFAHPPPFNLLSSRVILGTRPPVNPLRRAAPNLAGWPRHGSACPPPALLFAFLPFAFHPVSTFPVLPASAQEPARPAGRSGRVTAACAAETRPARPASRVDIEPRKPLSRLPIWLKIFKCS